MRLAGGSTPPATMACPDGCVLELDLLSVPQETGGFDPFAMIASGGKPLVLREAVAAIHRAARIRG